ncbi:hypothetical protein B5H41_16555, partial [Listeria monocytogenes]|nr:hypothetical protein [Listeria monocytogenes]
TVYRENEEITDTLSNLDFFWYKVDKNGVHDTNWEQNAYGKGKMVSVSDLDLEDIAKITCRVNVHKNKWVQAIYFINGLKALAYRVEQLRTEDTLVVPVITDTHYATDVMNKEDIRGNLMVFDHLKNFVEFTNMVECDFVLHNGDFVDGRTTKKENVKNIGEFMGLLGQVDCPYFIALGNHDDNRYGNRASGNVMNQVIYPQEMYQLVTTTARAFGVVENPSDRNSYYYYDVPDKKYRHIMLNTFDHPYTSGANQDLNYINNGGYREKQIKWLIDVLKNTPSDYTVSLSQHCSMGTGYNDTNPEYLFNALIVEGIVGAFRNGTTYIGENKTDKDFLVSVNVTFDQPHKVAFVANGHHHVDRMKVVNNVMNITTAICNPEGRPQTWFTLTQDLWDVFLINAKTKHVDVLRYGYSDKNRQFDY